MSPQPSPATATLSPALPTPNSPDRMHKLGLGALLFAHMTVDMQTSSLTVFLPLLLASFNLNYASAAAILSVNNLIIAIAQPLFGLFGDRRQVRWLVTAGCALCGAAMASVLFLPNYW